MSARYTLAPGVVVVVTGAGHDARHLEAEYGPTAAAPPERAAPAATPVLEITVGTAAATVGGTPGRGGHRAARWRTRLDLTAQRLGLRTAGPLAPLLAQSFVVEPVLSLLTAAAGRVLLPGALLLDPAGPTLVLGRSGAGKSMLATRALAGGVLVGADDQVLLAATGDCAGLARRLRVYPDLATVAPDAYARLPRAARRRVRLAGAVRAATGGRVDPPTAVAITALAASADAQCAGTDHPLARVLVLGSGASPSHDEVLGLAQTLLAEQRARARVAGAVVSASALRTEAELIDAALGGVTRGRLDARAGDGREALAAIGVR